MYRLALALIMLAAAPAVASAAPFGELSPLTVKNPARCLRAIEGAPAAPEPSAPVVEIGRVVQIPHGLAIRRDRSDIGIEAARLPPLASRSTSTRRSSFPRSDFGSSSISSIATSRLYGATRSST